MGVIISVAVGFISGILSSMGFGGGTVLILYFALFTGISQMMAQGINLVYFLPVASLSLVFHIRNKIIKLNLLPPLIIFGIIGALAGSYFSTRLIGQQMLRKMFAICIFAFGIYELFTKYEKGDGADNEKSKQTPNRRQGQGKGR